MGVPSQHSAFAPFGGRGPRSSSSTQSLALTLPEKARLVPWCGPSLEYSSSGWEDNGLYGKSMDFEGCKGCGRHSTPGLGIPVG